jgi:hypothetical protein
MSTAAIIGNLMATDPESALLKIEGRGEGTVAVIELAGRTYRVQVDELNLREDDPK